MHLRFEIFRHQLKGFDQGILVFYKISRTIKVGETAIYAD